MLVNVANWSFVLGAKRGMAERSTACVGSDESEITTAFAFARFGLTPIPSNRSVACAKSASCSVARRRARLVASSSSSSSESRASASRRAFRRAWRCSSMRSALDFLFAAASALALASASAAFLAFSRSTSESSAASQESRIYCDG